MVREVDQGEVRGGQHVVRLVERRQVELQVGRVGREVQAALKSDIRKYERKSGEYLGSACARGLEGVTLLHCCAVALLRSVANC